MAKLLDPVCGMTVDDTALRAPGYDDVAFCAPGCRTTFLEDPSAYQNRLGGADPMPKKCTCGKHPGGLCTCGTDHDEAGHEGHGHDDHAHEAHNPQDHDHECHSNPDQVEDVREPVASESGCCGGNGG